MSMSTGKMTSSQALDFAQFLVDQVPVFDEFIMEEIRPYCQTEILPRRVEQWWIVREKVRKIIEGNSFIPSHKVLAPKEYTQSGDGGWLLNVSAGTIPMGTPVEVTQDRFRAVFPNSSKVWKRI